MRGWLAVVPFLKRHFGHEVELIVIRAPSEDGDKSDVAWGVLEIKLVPQSWPGHGSVGCVLYAPRYPVNAEKLRIGGSPVQQQQVSKSNVSDNGFSDTTNEKVGGSPEQWTNVDITSGREHVDDGADAYSDKTQQKIRDHIINIIEESSTSLKGPPSYHMIKASLEMTVGKKAVAIHKEIIYSQLKLAWIDVELRQRRNADDPGLIRAAYSNAYNTYCNGSVHDAVGNSPEQRLKQASKRRKAEKAKRPMSMFAAEGTLNPHGIVDVKRGLRSTASSPSKGEARSPPSQRNYTSSKIGKCILVVLCRVWKYSGQGQCMNS